MSTRPHDTRAELRRRIRGLYGMADAVGGDPVGLGGALLEGGARIVQLRCKDWPEDEVLRAARELRDLCNQHGALFIVNDSAEIAVAADADGVHVGQTDGPSGPIRRVLGPNRLLGRSTNGLEQIPLALSEADYLAFGPVWPTTHLSRPKEVQGAERLSAARALVPADLPLVAIGGITPERLPAVRAAGADAWAVIGAIAHAADPVAATRALLGEGA